MNQPGHRVESGTVPDGEIRQPENSPLSPENPSPVQTPIPIEQPVPETQAPRDNIATSNAPVIAEAPRIAQTEEARILEVDDAIDKNIGNLSDAGHLVEQMNHLQGPEN